MQRGWWLVVTLLAVSGLRAQAPVDTSDDAEVQQLQQRIRQRWNERVRQDLKLSNDQASHLQATEGRFLERRRELGRNQRAVADALHAQLQPGVAANSDRVRQLMDARDRNRAALAQLERDEDREIGGYLSPVQHARYQVMREQLRRRIQEIREQRRGMGPQRRAARPRRRP
jgi:hypothetical protein